MTHIITSKLFFTTSNIAKCLDKKWSRQAHLILAKSFFLDCITHIINYLEHTYTSLSKNKHTLYYYGNFLIRRSTICLRVLQSIRHRQFHPDVCESQKNKYSLLEPTLFYIKSGGHLTSIITPHVWGADDG